METWELNSTGKKPKLNDPILIEGLPGIGNVGKVVVDFLIDQLKAEKLYDVWSNTFPHSVFVNEKNLVELPKIEIYYKKRTKGRDILFLSGDVQPSEGVACYEFSEKIIDLLVEIGGKEIVTIGGIGLQSIPKKPQVFCTGNNKKLIQNFKKGVELNSNLYGVVGPIVGVSGLLLGLSQKKKVKAISMLAETFAHPMYIGVRGAREIIDILNKKLELKVNLKQFDKEIQSLKEEHHSNKEKEEDKSRLSKLKNKMGETSYIG